MKTSVEGKLGRWISLVRQTPGLDLIYFATSTAGLCVQLAAARIALSMTDDRLPDWLLGIYSAGLALSAVALVTHLIKLLRIAPADSAGRWRPQSPKL